MYMCVLYCGSVFVVLCYITGVHAYGDTEQRTSVYSTVSAVYICKTHTYNTILTTTPLLVSKYQGQTKNAHTKRLLIQRS